MNPEWMQAYLADQRYPNRDMASGIKEWSVLAAKQSARPLKEVIEGTWQTAQAGAPPATPGVGGTARDIYARGARAVTQPVAEGVGRLFQTLSPKIGTDMEQDQGGFSQPATGVYKATGQGLAETLIPQTPEALAMGLAAGPISRIGTGAQGIVQTLRGAGQRMGAMGAVGGAAAGVTGGDVTEGAASGVLGQAVVGESARLALGMLRSKTAFRARRDLVKRYNVEIEDMAEGLLKDAPGLFTPVPGAAPIPGKGYALKDFLYRRRGREGRLAISAAYEAADQMVYQVMGRGRRDISLPSLDAVAGLAPGRGQMFYTAEEALQALKLATSGHGSPRFRSSPNSPEYVGEIMVKLNKGGGAIHTPDGPDTFNVRYLAKALKEDVLAAIAMKSQAASDMYRGATSQYRRDMAAWKMLSESKMWSGETTSGLGAVGDPNKVREYMKLHAEDFGEDLFPETAKKLYRGAMPGAEEVVSKAMGARLYAGRGLSERLPEVPYTQEFVGGNRPTGSMRVPAIAAYMGANAASSALAPPIKDTVAASEAGGWATP